MDSNDIQNDKIKSSLINVETLQKEYENTLQQYQEAVNNYISILENNSENELISMKGRSWWGISKLNEGTVQTEEECRNMCFNDEQCSGATFNESRHYCWTRKGNSQISVGKDDDTALIRKSTESLVTMKRLNEKLIDLNSQIVSELSNSQPLVEEQKQDKEMVHVKLNDSYQKLLEQKVEMDKQLREYYTIEQYIDNSSLFVNQKNSVYIFWVLIVCLLFLYIFRIPGGFIFSIIILLIFTYTLRTPNGFVIWFILLVIVCYLHF